MRILVTGAAGGIGRAVTAELVRARHDVVALDRTPAASGPGVRVVVGDATDPAVVGEAAEGMDCVVHLAAIPSPVGHAPHEVFATNTAATFAVLQAAGERGVPRVVAASSLSALGFAWARRPPSPQYVPLDEEHPPVTEDAYGLSKLVDETTAAVMHRRHGTTVVLLRLPFVGAGPRLWARVRDVADDPATARGELWAWLHTADAAEAFRVAAERDLTGSHLLTVAAPDTLSALPTAELLARYHPRTVVRAALPDRASPVSSARAEGVLAWAAHRGWS